MQTTCRTCNGAGQFIRDPCGTCHGKGEVQKKDSINIQIPKGITENEAVRFSKNNQEYRIRFKIRQSTQFIRDGDDIHSDINISVSQAS